MYNYKLIIFKGVVLRLVRAPEHIIFSKSQALNTHNSRNIVSSAGYLHSMEPLGAQRSDHFIMSSEFYMFLFIYSRAY